MSDQEKSESGAPIYRHRERDKPFEMATGGENIERISEHIEAHIGKVDGVYHEMISDLVHIDVHIVKPTDEQPFYTLITSGMSDKPMNVPEGFEDHRYAELCVLLPADWDLSQEAFEDENNYWPVRWLKMLARLPHEYNTWVSWGHTIPNGEEAYPLSDYTDQGCIMLMPSIDLPDAFHELKIDEEKTIRFYALVPLYKEEMDLKLKMGAERLLDKFEMMGVSSMVDLQRVNTCA